MRREKIFATGGGRAGWVNATFPLVTLTATRDKLEVNGVLGKYTFSPEQVVAIDQYEGILIFGRGIQICHNVASYTEEILFWCVDSPSSLIAQIKETGFLPAAHPDIMLANRGTPTRLQALVAMMVLWNLLIMTDLCYSIGLGATRGFLSFLAVFILFSGSIAIKRARWLQRLILKPGRSPSEIKAWLRLLAFSSGIMSIAMAGSLLAGFG